MSRQLTTAPPAGPEESSAAGFAALGEGRWDEAHDRFAQSLAAGPSGEARLGLAAALWWQGESRASVEACRRAYAELRRAGATELAVQYAIRLAITYKADFANFAAANGWIGRADRLLEALPAGPLHAYAAIARAYRMPDLAAAEVLTVGALEVGRANGDVDLELGALSQLGLIHVGQGRLRDGFALIDEATAAALAGEGSQLDTVAYTCCDMLNACELAGDAERAAEWCTVADEFAATYGCPFLYAECRIYYGSVLTARGRWAEAERELATGRRVTEGVSPGLHDRASTRLALLRVRQGRWEEADTLLASVGGDGDAAAHAALSAAALCLARGDAAGAGRLLGRRLRRTSEHRATLVVALGLLVEAQVAAGAVDEAAESVDRLAEAVAGADSPRLRAALATATGQVAAARGDVAGAVTDLETALGCWSAAGLPYEQARTRLVLAGVVASGQPDVAIEAAGRAMAELEALGATPDAARAGALLRELGVAARGGPKGTGPLTQREREVLRLLGAGLSNPEIAQRLFISRKTAAHHVSNVLAKLHVRNRAEAAARAEVALAEWVT